MATLELIGLRKNFGATEVLRQIDLSLTSGEMLVIVGASGCGKSTLLRMVAGLEAPSAGQVLLDGKDITSDDPASRDIAMVFQNYALYPHMTVFDNMAYGLRIRGLSREDIARRVNESAALLGLSELLARKPRQLSGGQRQRVAMGRAIVREPKLFLFDEPLSNLDATLGDRLLVLHQGQPAQFATPMEVFEKPADTYVASFIGAPAMNFLPAVMANDGTAARLAAGPLIGFVDGKQPSPDGTALTIGIRPEHIQIDPDGLPFRIDLVEPLGSETLVHGRLVAPGEDALVIRLQGRPPSGEGLKIGFPARDIHVFDAGSGRRLVR